MRRPSLKTQAGKIRLPALHPLVLYAVALAILYEHRPRLDEVERDIVPSTLVAQRLDPFVMAWAGRQGLPALLALPKAGRQRRVRTLPRRPESTPPICRMSIRMRGRRCAPPPAESPQAAARPAMRRVCCRWCRRARHQWTCMPHCRLRREWPSASDTLRKTPDRHRECPGGL